MISTNVFAKWTRFGDSTDGATTVYIDFETIKKKGHKVKIWSLMDFKTVQKPPSGTKYLSTLSHDEYDCEEETNRMLDLYSYSRSMGQGEIVYSSTNIKNEAESILPGSIAEGLLKLACGKKWKQYQK